MSNLQSLSFHNVRAVADAIFTWKTKDGHPLKPSTLSSLISALATGVTFLRGSPPTRELMTARRKLRKRMAVFIPRQAVPMSKAEVRRALFMASSEELRCRIALSWALALRSGDLQHIHGSDVLEVTNSAAILRMRGVKMTQPGDEGYFRAVLFEGITTPLRAFLRNASRQPSSLLFPHTTKRHLILTLKSVNRKLSGHSFRRGAATLLRHRGATLRSIKRLLAHKHIHTTRRYIHPSINGFQSLLRLQRLLC